MADRRTPRQVSRPPFRHQVELHRTGPLAIILAYAGTSLPLLLLIVASSGPMGDLLASEFLGEEIVRSAVGTIGLVLSVPITTALATLVAGVGNAAPTSLARHARH